jgi:sugar-specific transcriptional regulator TrmB
MKNEESLQKYLLGLNIDAAEAGTYIELLKLGPASALQISRRTKLSRTQTYRSLENLQGAGLVSAEPLSYGTMYKPLPLENIEATLAENESRISKLRNDMSTMVEVAKHISGSAGQKAVVQHHYGLAGLKQVNWNLTKAQGEFRVFEAAYLSQHLDHVFARRCREQYQKNNITSYDLSNKKTATAKDLEPFDPSKVQIRYIPEEVLTINFEVYIYNDVVTLLDYTNDQELAMEMHHPFLKMMMEQLFDAIWKIAEPIKFT